MPLTKEERRIRNTVGRIEDIPTVAPAPIPLNQDKAASKAIEKITKSVVVTTTTNVDSVLKDGSVPFVGTISGVTPTANNHLATKNYIDKKDLTSVTKSGNNVVFGMGDSSNNITFTSFGANAFNSTTIPTTYVASLSNSASGTGIVGLVDDSTGTIYSLKGGDNITLNIEGSESSDYLEIDCDINTANFISTSANRVEGIRKHSTDAFDFTQSAGSGKYIVIDDDNSNVSVTESTVTIANGTSYNAIRLNAPSVTNTNTTYSVSIPSSTTKLRLTAGGSGSGTDDIEFVGGGATTVTRTNDSKFTISSTDTNTDTNNYITGASISSSGVLTLTGSGSAGANVDLSEQFTLTGAGILTATSTATLTNKSGNISQWTNDSGYVTASSSTTFTNKGGNISQWTNDSNYLTSHQDISGKANLSGATFTGDISAPNVKSTTSGIIKAIAGTTADRSGLTIYNSGESGYLSYTVTTSDHASGWGWELSNQAANATSPTYSVRVDYSGSTMKVKGDVIAYVSSDPKLKTNKELISNPLNKLMKLGGYSFDWKEEATKHGNHLVGHDYGVMADEVEALFPELVTTRENDGETMKAVDYKKLIPLLIESVKDLTNKLVQRGVLDEEL